MSNSSNIIQLGIIVTNLSLYGSIFLLIFGLFGNLLNCFVFIQRNLRRNPCVIYFFVSSLINLILFPTAFIPEILNGWNAEYDLLETISGLCQFVVFIIFNSRSIVAWLITFASVDRYFVSSPNIHRRQMSNFKNTFSYLIIICLISSCIWLGEFFCFKANTVGTPLKCYTKLNQCRAYNNWSQSLIMVILPICLMLIFGFYTIKNIQEHRQILPRPINGISIGRNRRNERSLTKMLLLQIFILTILSLPFAIITIYLSYTFYQEKSLIQIEIENLLFNLFLLIEFIPNCISFFLYTLSGSLFRKTLIDCGKKLRRHLFIYQ